MFKRERGHKLSALLHTKKIALSYGPGTKSAKVSAAGAAAALLTRGILPPGGRAVKPLCAPGLPGAEKPVVEFCSRHRKGGHPGGAEEKQGPRQRRRGFAGPALGGGAQRLLMALQLLFLF